MMYHLPAGLVDGRAEYLAFYGQFIDSIRLTEPEAAVELMLLVGDGCNPHGSRFNLPFRIDIIAGTPANPDLMAVELDELPRFNPCILALSSGNTAQISPFPWHCCDIVFTGTSEDWTAVLDWFERWFDRHETHVAEDHGLSGVIHSMSEPQALGQSQVFTVDFGSAPTSAFEDLITVLDSMGLQDLKFGNLTNHYRAKSGVAEGSFQTPLLPKTSKGHSP